MPASYLSPKTCIRKSPIEGRGLFARRRIRTGETVAIKGGHVYDARTLAKVKGWIADSYIQIADGFSAISRRTSRTKSGAVTGGRARNRVGCHEPR